MLILEKGFNMTRELNKEFEGIGEVKGLFLFVTLHNDIPYIIYK
jgi:hypothetical protein